MPIPEQPDGQQGVTPSGLDPNERLPDGRLKPSAKAHPEDFTRNTGEGGVVKRHPPLPDTAPSDTDATIIPSDSRGG